MQFSNISTGEGSSAPAYSTQSNKTQLVNKRNPPYLQELRSSSDSLLRSTSHDEPQLKASDNQVITTQALTENVTRREYSSSSSSESVNSQEGFQLRDGPSANSQLERSLSEGDGPSVTDATNLTNTFSPSSTSLSSRNRQEILEQRHQELLNKQKQLQDQYTKLQHAQLLTRFSSLRRALSDIEPGYLKKTGSETNILSKKHRALISASGSMTHLPTSVKPNIMAPKDNEVLSQMVKKIRKADTLPPSSDKLHEMDII